MDGDDGFKPAVWIMAKYEFFHTFPLHLVPQLHDSSPFW
jgi:hypothetical protein